MTTLDPESLTGDGADAKYTLPGKRSADSGNLGSPGASSYSPYKGYMRCGPKKGILSSLTRANKLSSYVPSPTTPNLKHAHKKPLRV